MDVESKSVKVNETLMKKQRNAAFELLRILCMLLIVSTHFLGHGKWMENMQGINFVLGRILQSLTRPAVNLFVMISAYFLSTSKSADINWRKIGKLYLQVYFYNVVLYVSTLISGDCTFDTTNLASTIFPLITGKYWFFTSYVIMLLASPYINILLRHITLRQHLGICVFFVIAGSLSAGIHTLPQFPLEYGFNAIWFVGLYFIASLIRRSEFSISTKTKPIAIAIYAIAVIAGCFYTIGYSSIITVAHSLVIFLFFKDLKIKNNAASKIICAISPLTFGVYLIHDSNEMRAIMYEKIFHSSSYWDSNVAFLLLVCFILLTFIVCACVEFVRVKLFDAIPVFIKSIRNKSIKIDKQ